jgi:uncharacterized membrane protein YfcA
LISILAGIFGSILGLGGGVIIVPALTLLLGVNIRYAVGASIVSVIATSSGAAASYVKDHITNVRLAMLLEVATTLGALAGASLSPWIPSQWLFLIFALILLYSAAMMLKPRLSETLSWNEAHPLAIKLKINSTYPDKLKNAVIPYGVAALPLGFFLMLCAGVMSGLLGIGSGALKVPAMDRAMKLPIKVSSATSNFMIGVTAAASAGAYYVRGDILPFLSAPVALGVMLGATLGTKIMVKLHSQVIRRLFLVILLVISIQMGLKAFGVHLR